MQVKTITTVAGVNEIDFGNDCSQSTAHFYWLKNLGDSTLYVSANPNPIAEKDDVAELPAKGAVSVETDEGKIYILGAGKVEIHRTNSKFCPFDWQSSGSGGGGGGSITVDSELSDTSTNPLQNKVTTAAIKEVNSNVETKSDINHIHDISASGNPVVMDNLQGGVPFSEMVVSGKNLIPYPYQNTNTTHNGVTFTVNNDGSIIANGTATENATFTLWDLSHKFAINSNETYTLSGCPLGGSNTTFALYNIGTQDIDHGDGKTFTEKSDFAPRIAIYKGYTANNLVFRPQLELGDTATAYEPPITSQEVTITRCGKNLLNVYIPTKREYVVNNTTFTINDDGSVSAISTETEKTATRLSLSMTCPPGDYMFSGSTHNGFTTYIYNRTKNTVTAWANPNPVPCHIDKENEYTLYFMVGVNCKANGDICKPQLELGDTATEYEPYHADTISITPTFNPYTIQNDLLQYNDINTLIASIGELKVVGVQKNAAVKKVWDEITEVEHNADSMQSEITALGNVNAEGTLVVLDDLQGGVPFSEMVVSGKNLLTYPYKESTKTVNGITFTDNGDGTITVNGTATANATFSLSSKIVYKSGVDYVISGCPNGGDRKFKIKGNSDGVNADDVGYGKTFSFSEDTECSVSILIYKDVTVENLIFRPQIELGATPTAYEPPITGRELTLAVSGKNLINNIQATGTVVGVTVTKNDDGTVTINGTTTGDLWLLFDDKCRVVKDKTYTFSMGFDASVGIMFGVRSGDNAQSYLSTGASGSFVAPETGICRIRGYAKSGITFDNLTIYPQLETGSTATPYEPYNGTEYNITPDNNPYTIPNDICQLDGLNNISVSAGELSVVGAQRNAAIKKIWDKFTSIDNDIADLYSKISTLEFNTTASIEAKGQEIVAVRHALDELASVPNDIVSLRSDNETLHAEIEELRALIKTT